MAEEHRCALEVPHVHAHLPHVTHPDCTIKLYPSQIQIVCDGEIKVTIHLSAILSIDVHQPIFSANYINGEFLEQGGKTSFTFTFKSGGATEFARMFFRLTEGRLVTGPDNQPTDTHQDNNNENRKTK